MDRTGDLWAGTSSDKPWNTLDLLWTQTDETDQRQETKNKPGDEDPVSTEESPRTRPSGSTDSAESQTFTWGWEVVKGEKVGQCNVARKDERPDV